MEVNEIRGAIEWSGTEWNRREWNGDDMNLKEKERTYEKVL
jgi:hypothetical protein